MSTNLPTLEQIKAELDSIPIRPVGAFDHQNLSPDYNTPDSVITLADQTVEIFNWTDRMVLLFYREIDPITNSLRLIGTAVIPFNPILAAAISLGAEGLKELTKLQTNQGNIMSEDTPTTTTDTPVETKSWYQSKTIWGTIVLVACGGYAIISHHTIDATTQAGIVDNLLGLVTAVAGILSIVGRINASTKIGA